MIDTDAEQKIITVGQSDEDNTEPVSEQADPEPIQESYIPEVTSTDRNNLDPAIISSRIKAERERGFWPQGVMAQHLMVTAPAISGWESGRSVPTEENFEKIARLCKCDAAYLKGEQEERRKP